MLYYSASRTAKLPSKRSSFCVFGSAVRRTPERGLYTFLPPVQRFNRYVGTQTNDTILHGHAALSRTATVPAREFLFATEVGVTANMADFREKVGED